VNLVRNRKRQLIRAKPNKTIIGFTLIASSVLVFLRVMLTYRTSLDLMGPLLPLELGAYMGGSLIAGLCLLRPVQP
jgi:hypothetical protein